MASIYFHKNNPEGQLGGREGGCALQHPPAPFLVLQLHLATGQRKVLGPGTAAGPRLGGQRGTTGARPWDAAGFQHIPCLLSQRAHPPLLADELLELVCISFIFSSFFPSLCEFSEIPNLGCMADGEAQEQAAGLLFAPLM